jgi:hypothetical protein
LIGELAIGASAEGRGSVADTAESTAAGAPSAGSKSRDEPEDGAAPEAAPGPDKASFDNTRKHVAERAAGTPDAARFAHTKQSQAAPSGGDEVPPGARFAMTNRQAGRSGEASPPRPEVVTVGAGEAPVEIRIDHDGRKAPARPAAAAPQAPPATPAGQNGRAAAPPQGLPPAEPAPSKVPVDSSKTFVGSNGTYYDEAWRWMGVRIKPEVQLGGGGKFKIGQVVRHPVHRLVQHLQIGWRPVGGATAAAEFALVRERAGDVQLQLLEGGAEPGQLERIILVKDKHGVDAGQAQLVRDVRVG